jgi:hypothetical protein
MRYKPKRIAALHSRQDAGLGRSRYRSVSKDCWRASKDDVVARKFCVTTPQEVDPKSVIGVSKANVATRVSPKT